MPKSKKAPAPMEPGRAWYRAGKNGRRRWKDSGGFVATGAADPSAEVEAPPSRPKKRKVPKAPPETTKNPPSTGELAEPSSAESANPGQTAPETQPTEASGLDSGDIPPADIPPALAPEQRPGDPIAEAVAGHENRGPDPSTGQPVQEKLPDGATLPPATPATPAAPDPMSKLAGRMVATGLGVALCRIGAARSGVVVPMSDAESAMLADATTAVLARYLPSLSTNHPELWNLALVSGGIVAMRLAIPPKDEEDEGEPRRQEEPRRQDPPTKPKPKPPTPIRPPKGAPPAKAEDQDDPPAERNDRAAAAGWSI